jgi:hypothetical protein
VGVGRETGEFVQGCKSTKVVGWNAYKLLEAAADVGPQQGRRQVMQLLREASRLGLNTVRLSGEHSSPIRPTAPRPA